MGEAQRPAQFFPSHQGFSSWSCEQRVDNGVCPSFVFLHFGTFLVHLQNSFNVLFHQASHLHQFPRNSFLLSVCHLFLMIFD